MKTLLYLSIAALIPSGLAASYTVTIDPKLYINNIRIAIFQKNDSDYKEVISKRINKLTTTLPAGKYTYLIWKQNNTEFETFSGEFNLSKNMTITPRIIVFPTMPNEGANFFKQLSIRTISTIEACNSDKPDKPDEVCAIANIDVNTYKSLVSLNIKDEQVEPFTDYGTFQQAVFKIDGKLYTLLLYPLQSRVSISWSYKWK